MGYHQQLGVKIQGKYYYRYEKGDHSIFPFLMSILNGSYNLNEFIETTGKETKDDSCFLVDLDEMTWSEDGFAPSYDDMHKVHNITKVVDGKNHINKDCFLPIESKLDLIAGKLSNKSKDQIKESLRDNDLKVLLLSLLGDELNKTETKTDPKAKTSPPQRGFYAMSLAGL